MNTRAHVIFTGRVQGVFFRANTLEKAREMKVSGWVRNRRDGTVEAIFEGTETAVHQTIEWCSKSQPYAVVDDVRVEWETAKGEFDDFSIIH